MWAMPRRCSYTKQAGSETVSEDSRKNNFGFWSRITLTPALSHRMGEGESSSVGRRIQPLWKLLATGLAVPSPVGRERVRVRAVLLVLRLLSGTCFCTNPHYCLLTDWPSFSRANSGVCTETQTCLRR